MGMNLFWTSILYATPLVLGVVTGLITDLVVLQNPRRDTYAIFTALMSTCLLFTSGACTIWAHMRMGTTADAIMLAFLPGIFIGAISFGLTAIVTRPIMLPHIEAREREIDQMMAS